MSEECTPSMCEGCTSDCADRMAPQQPESFLDIGQPVGPALPVVVKTLVLATKASP